LRAGWTAQELLVTFCTIIGEVTLIPGVNAVFIAQVDVGWLLNILYFIFLSD
ncbi:hypothetical protein C2G38_1953547, partial [Gigaspora rosea]